MTESGETTQSIWNEDEEQFKVIFSLKNQAAEFFHSWDMENLYLTLRGMKRELKAKLKPEEKEDVENELTELDKLREIYLQHKNSAEIKSKYYLACEIFYEVLTGYMKLHGLYFREQRDASKAVLRRG